ncbi:MAG: LemA family protein [Candidatus Pacebacteria bacterium]|jgi:LemA protein|nr:LemA family protein [Candidatus Paceibacterota bacterium]
MSLTSILLIAAGVIVIWAIAAYNRFVSLKNRAQEAWSDIDIQLKRRYDLIPNLVSTVKGYAAHESTVFEKVTEARANALTADAGSDKQAIAQAENMLTSAMKSIFAVAEAYPDLKANTNFLELQRELSDTENKIQAARRFYNTNVMELNTKIDSFPANIIAGMCKFKEMELFQLEDAAAKNPVAVSF